MADDIRPLFFIRRGKPAMTWYNFDTHWFSKKPEKVRWQVTTISYECGSVHSAWHIDQTLMLEEGKMSDISARGYCFKYLGKAMTKVAITGRGQLSMNWLASFGLYKEQIDLQVILDSMGIGYVTNYTDESEGQEEILEIWRCQK